MARSGFSQRVRSRHRNRGRLEPKSGWRLGVKTSRAPEGAGRPDPEETDEERAKRIVTERTRRARLSDYLAHKDVADLGLDADHTPAGQPLVRRFRGGSEPRHAHHEDPVEDRRTNARPSTSVWSQDPRSQHVKDEAAESDWPKRLGFEGNAAVGDLRRSVVDGFRALVETRWNTLTDQSLPNAAEVEYQASKPRQSDDGRVPTLLNTAELRRQHREVVPPIDLALAHVRCDPALLHLAAGEYLGAEHEPPVANPVHPASGDVSPIDAELGGLVLPEDEHSRLVQSGAMQMIARAQERVTRVHVDLCLSDPDKALVVEERWAAERDELSGRVRAGSPRPEESRVLLRAIDDYAAGMQPVFDDARFVGQLHRDLGIGDGAPVPADVLDRARDHAPDRLAAVAEVRVSGDAVPFDELAGPRDRDSLVAALRLETALGRAPTAGEVDSVRDASDFVAGLRAVEPDSPLLFRPPDYDGDYPELVRGVVDGAALSSPPVSSGAVFVDLAEACQRGDVPDRVPVAERAPAPVDPDLVRREASERLTALTEACAAAGVRVGTGPHRGEPVDVTLPSDLVESRDAVVDGRECVLCTITDLDAAVEGLQPALRELATELAYADRRPAVELPGDAVRDAFALRVASQVLDRPLDDALLGRPSDELERTQLLVDHLADHDDQARRTETERLAQREAAIEHFDVVCDAFERQGVVVASRADAALNDRTAPTFGVTAGGSAVVRLHSALVRDPDGSVADRTLQRAHAHAYVAFGRAAGGLPRVSDARAADYQALHAGGTPAGRAVRASSVRVPDDRSLVDPALREQLVADAFATERMRQGWGQSARPLRAVERSDKARTLDLGPSSGAWPDRAVQLVSHPDQGKELRRSVAKAGNFVGKAVDAYRESINPDPPSAPAPAAAARSVDRTVEPVVAR